jgi:SPP1 family predicted phage head-tail adaptor
VIQAGQLDRRVTLQRPSPVDDGYTRTPGFADVATVWARRTKAGANKRLAAAQVGGTITHSFLINWSSKVAPVDTQWRLVCEGRVYEIVSADQVGRREGIIIDATASAETPA